MKKIGNWIWSHWWRLGTLGLFLSFMLPLWFKDPRTLKDCLSLSLTFLGVFVIPFAAGMEHKEGKIAKILFDFKAKYGL